MLPSGIPHAEDSREPRQQLIAQGPASSLRSPASNQTDPASHPRPDQHPQASPRRPRRARASPPLSARPSASPGLQSRVCPPPTRTHRPRPRRLATPASASQSCGCERRDRPQEARAAQRSCACASMHANRSAHAQQRLGAGLAPVVFGSSWGRPLQEPYASRDRRTSLLLLSAACGHRAKSLSNWNPAVTNVIFLTLNLQEWPEG